MKANPRITAKDRNALKGAIRRAFSRSELHKSILSAAVIEHFDPERPRVKTWCRCQVCKKPEARSYMQVDHMEPVIPIDKHFEDMSLDEAVDRLWCDQANLQAICESCHDLKTAQEREARKPYRKSRKKSLR